MGLQVWSPPRGVVLSVLEANLEGGIVLLKVIILFEPTLVRGAEVSHKAIGKRGWLPREQFLCRGWGVGCQFEQLGF